MNKTPPIEEPVYEISKESQGSADPRPYCCDKDGIPLQDLPLLDKVPLLNSLSIINRFDNILITAVSDNDEKPRNEPGKVQECREHPSGKHYLLVAWWYDRKTLAKVRPGYWRYLNDKWPLEEPFKYILSCQFDVIDIDTVVARLPNDDRFCKTMVYGGVHHKHKIFSQGISRSRRDLTSHPNPTSLLSGGS